MRSKPVFIPILAPVMLLLAGCSPIGEKSASVSVIYGAAALLSLLLLAGYCAVAKKRDPWYLLLFSSVLVVNIGYFALGISRDLNEALLANRLAYLGSVFLPFAMCMIILRVTHIQYWKQLPLLLLGISTVVFLIAASPGYLDIYYRQVTLEQLNGVSVLNKVYGPLHGVYLIFLLGYFSAMVSFIVYATLKDKIESLAYAVLLAIAVFVNIGVWLIEQLVHIDFEFLSISYIISECFLLGLHLMISEAEHHRLQTADPSPIPQAPAPVADVPTLVLPQPAVDQAQVELFAAGLATLTPREQSILECYANGMTTAQIMENLSIKENTLKFHNKNLYSKLGVSSRKQLLSVYNIYQTLRQSQ